MKKVTFSKSSPTDFVMHTENGDIIFTLGEWNDFVNAVVDFDTQNCSILKISENEMTNVAETSFFGNSVKTTYNTLFNIFGEDLGPSADGKVHHKWALVSNTGIYFTLYDWKEYNGYDNDNIISWNIGVNSSEDGLIIEMILKDILNL